jgi:hypothetical protein
MKLVVAICPSALFAMMPMTDLSFGAVALILAPLNAVLYGFVGFLLGLSLSGDRSEKSDPLWSI